MRSSTRRTLVISLLGLASCFYLAAADGARWIDFEFPADSPVLVSSFSLGPTRAHVLGSSMALDLHALVVLRNTGTKPIAGLTLRVEAPGLSSAGKGSVTVPSLHAQPGDSFPVHIDMQAGDRHRAFSCRTQAWCFDTQGQAGDGLGAGVAQHDQGMQVESHR